MAKDTYDILKSLLPAALFQSRAVGSFGDSSDPAPPSVIKGKNPEPFDTLSSPTLSLRVDRGETFTITFPSGSISASEAVDAINAESQEACGKDIATELDGFVTVASLQGDIEVIEGNIALGLYETRDLYAFLKILAPSIHEYRELVDSFFDRTMSLESTDVAFLSQIGLLLGYSWDYSKDVDSQVAIIKQLPFLYRYKGTIPSVQWSVRIHGGDSRIFQPYPYIMRYEESAFDGEPIKARSRGRALTGGSTSSSSPTLFVDEVNTPFEAEDELCYIFIPELAGPVKGYRIAKVLSSSVVELPEASFGTASGLFYQILIPSLEPHRIEDHTYWHKGVYEVCANIPPHLYRQDLKKYAHPKSRLVYFCYRYQPEPVEAALDPQQLVFHRTLIHQLLIRFNQGCGAVFDTSPGFDELEAKFDGCQFLFGVYRTLTKNLFTVARAAPDNWSQLLYYRELMGRIPYLNLYAYSEPFNELTWYEDGYDHAPPLLDAHPDVHKRIWGFSEEITHTSGGPDTLPASIPIGSEILLLNEGGTLDKDNDVFLGGTDYLEGADWSQNGGAIEWSGSEPADSATYRVFYAFDPWNPFGVGTGVVPHTGDGDTLEDADGSLITAW